MYCWTFVIWKLLRMGNKNCTGSFWVNTVTWSSSTEKSVLPYLTNIKIVVTNKWFVDARVLESVDPIVDKSSVVKSGSVFSCTCLCLVGLCLYPPVGTSCRMGSSGVFTWYSQCVQQRGRGRLVWDLKKSWKIPSGFLLLGAGGCERDWARCPENNWCWRLKASQVN